MSGRRNKLPGKLAKARRKELEENLESALVEHRPVDYIANMSLALQAAKAVERRYKRPNITALLMVGFSMVAAASIVGLGVSTAVPTALVELTASTTSLRFLSAHTGEFQSEEAFVMQSVRPFYVSQLDIIDPLSHDADNQMLKGLARIEHMRVGSSTRLRLRQESTSCLVLQVGGKAEGTDAGWLFLQLGVMDNAPPENAWPKKHHIGPGGTVRLCDISDREAFLYGMVEELAITRVYKEESPRLEMSSIIRGRASLTNTSRTWELSANDRVFIGKIKDGRLGVKRGDGAVDVFFSGETTEARIAGNDPLVRSKDNLMPSIVEFFVDSPTALFISLAVALCGVFWHAVGLYYQLRS